MIAKLEGTLSNVHQNIEQLQTSTMGLTINNKSTTTETPPLNGQQPLKDTQYQYVVTSNMFLKS